MKTFSKNDTLVVRGIAITMLMFHHNFRLESVFKGMSFSFFPFSQSSVVIFCNFLKICVGMFAFLSAYGLTLSLRKYDNNSLLNSRQYSHFISNKLLNLMWGFWFIFILSEILCAIIAPSYTMDYFANGGVRGILNIFIDFLGLAKLVGTTSLNGTWWYMSLAILIILFVPFMVKLCKKFNAFASIAFLVIIPRLIYVTVPLHLGQTSNLFRFMLPTLLGVLAAQNNWLARLKSFTITNNKVLSKIIKFVVLTAGLVVLYIIRIKTDGKYANYIFEIRDGLIPAYVVYYCHEFITDIPLIKNVFALIGKHSLNIFLFHTFIRHHWFHAYTYSFKHFVLIALVLLAESLVISIVLEFIKKITHYNNLCVVIRNKINKRFYSDVQMNTSK